MSDCVCHFSLRHGKLMIEIVSNQDYTIEHCSNYLVTTQLQSADNI